MRVGWTSAIVCFVLFAAFAGCLQDPTPAVGPDSAPSAGARQVPQIDGKSFVKNLEAFVKKFPARRGGSSDHVGAREFLLDEFKTLGFEPWKGPFQADTPAVNICGLKLGTRSPERWVIVAGHYDSVTWDAAVFDAAAPGRLVSEGAYDDGSGIWMTVELARAFSKFENAYSIAFCGWDAGERGPIPFPGGKALRDDLKAGRFPYPVDEVHAVLNFDMFGICWPIRVPIEFYAAHEGVVSLADKARRAAKVPDAMYIHQGAPWLEERYFAADDVPVALFMSYWRYMPTPHEAMPRIQPAPYPWHHWQDTMDNMRLAAGGQAPLEQGFETAAKIAAIVLDAFANEPPQQWAS